MPSLWKNGDRPRFLVLQAIAVNLIGTASSLHPSIGLAEALGRVSSYIAYDLRLATSRPPGR